MSGVWIIPAVFGFWALTVLVRWLLARRERRRSGEVKGGPFRG